MLLYTNNSKCSSNNPKTLIIAQHVADVEQVIQKADIDDILRSGPKVGYMAQQGMMEREGMLKSMQGLNPLAVYAVFECFSRGGGKSVEERILPHPPSRDDLQTLCKKSNIIFDFLHRFWSRTLCPILIHTDVYFCYPALHHHH